MTFFNSGRRAFGDNRRRFTSRNDMVVLVIHKTRSFYGLINTLKGEGTGVAKNEATQVECELGIYQHWLTVGNDKAVPGLKEVHEWIRLVFGNDREMLTLEMNDESTLEFSFTDGDGTITANGGIASVA